VDDIKLMVAATTIRDHVPRDQPLEERLKFAMQYARQHKNDLFWMSYEADDDLMFRSAVGGVMLAASEDERERLTRSMQPLKMLSAAMSGIPVDFSALPNGDGIIPLMGLWHEVVKEEVK
jgi:hypothetical protein